MKNNAYMLCVVLGVDLDANREPSDPKIRAFVEFFNSDLRGDRFVHHCVGPSCCADKESCCAKAINLLLDVIFARMPQVPQSSRWTKVQSTLQWVMAGMMTHGVLQSAFITAFDPAYRHPDPSTRCIAPEEVQRLALQDVVLSDVLEEGTTAADYNKYQGIRLRRALEWMKNPRTSGLVSVEQLNLPDRPAAV
jgi:hypothetical protein